MTTQPEGRLALDGIYKNGYGIVPKYVMHDPDLSLESKTIYAYLCALAGGGETTFPYRETILRQLKLAKNTYYKHYDPLIRQGYITVSRPADKTAANIYTLVANPKKLCASTSAGGEGMLRYRGLRAHGYGSLPRAVMQDDRLSVKAKGLYAYFCAYCGAGDCAFPRKDHILHHLGVSEPTYYKALNSLKELDYLRVEQRKVSGRFSVNDYYLNEFPGAEASPLPKICDTEICDTKPDKPCNNLDAKPNLPNQNFCDTIPRDTETAHTKIDDPHIRTKPSKNNPISNNQSTGGGLRALARPIAEAHVGAERADALLDAFLPGFQKSAAKPGIRNMKAYLHAALDNFVTEQALPTPRTSSYDLGEIERMLENAAYW